MRIKFVSKPALPLPHEIVCGLTLQQPRRRHPGRGAAARHGEARVSNRPQPDLPLRNLPALNPTFDAEGGECPVNFDKNGVHLPT
jgi:hypothetical protein